MRLDPVLMLAALALAPSAAQAASPVEVTRFHTPATLAALGRGPITVVPAPGSDVSGIETRVFLEAVAAELNRGGIAVPGSGAPRIAEVRVTRSVATGERARSPVSVGVGGGFGSGSYRHGGFGGVGLGIGIGLGGGSKAMIDTELAVTIRDGSGASLWEGRADTRVKDKSRDAATQAVATRLARALFAGFPGRSGETIEVR